MKRLLFGTLVVMTFAAAAAMGAPLQVAGTQFCVQRITTSSTTATQAFASGDCLNTAATRVCAYSAGASTDVVHLSSSSTTDEAYGWPIAAGGAGRECMEWGFNVKLYVFHEDGGSPVMLYLRREW